MDTCHSCRDAHTIENRNANVITQLFHRHRKKVMACFLCRGVAFAAVAVALVFTTFTNPRQGTAVSAFTVNVCGRVARFPQLYLAVPRYGPPLSDNDDIPSPTEEMAKVKAKKREFHAMINEIMSATDPQHVPSILARQMYLILDMTGDMGKSIVESILKEVETEKGEEAKTQTELAIETALTFAEEFVEEAQKIDDMNKKLLGQIIKLLAKKDGPSVNREEELDQLFEDEKSKFTPGFLRHLDGECNRISSAPKMTPESIRLLEILRVIQTRVLEELGKDLGEAAQVLGQLIGYESKAERLAVLETGLMVRGTAFGKELMELTEEALEGFDRVPQQVEPGLVTCIQEIDERCRKFVGFQ